MSEPKENSNIEKVFNMEAPDGIRQCDWDAGIAELRNPEEHKKVKRLKSIQDGRSFNL